MINIKYVRKLINELDKYAREDEMKGSYHPDDRDDVEQSYKDSKDKLIKYLTKNIN